MSNLRIHPLYPSKLPSCGRNEWGGSATYPCSPVVAPTPANRKQLTHKSPPYPPLAISENKPFAAQLFGQSSSRSTKPHHK